MVRGPFEEAGRQGTRLLLVIAGGSAVFIVLALAISPAPNSSPSAPSQPVSWLDPSYVAYQLSLHVFWGFVAGAVSLDPAIALIGAAVGPSIDIDHLGLLAGLPVDARVGHSVLFVAFVVLIDWRLHFWGRGTRNFSLFISLEYGVHLAVAPPGFPLLAPLSSTTVFFPSIFPAALSVALAVAFLFDCLSLRKLTPEPADRGRLERTEKTPP